MASNKSMADGELYQEGCTRVQYFSSPAVPVQPGASLEPRCGRPSRPVSENQQAIVPAVNGAAGGAGDDSGNRIQEAQALLLQLGRKKFGLPVLEIEHRIRAIQKWEQLEELLLRLVESASWQDLFSHE
jgi:hypothetical protein